MRMIRVFHLSRSFIFQMIRLLNPHLPKLKETIRTSFNQIEKTNISFDIGSIELYLYLSNLTTSVAPNSTSVVEWTILDLSYLRIIQKSLLLSNFFPRTKPLHYAVRRSVKDETVHLILLVLYSPTSLFLTMSSLRGLPASIKSEFCTGSILSPAEPALLVLILSPSTPVSVSELDRNGTELFKSTPTPLKI
jgi:hypothetical protein